jgi:hypothetical protein
MHGDTVKSVYCHYDGYLSYTGEILLRCFDSTAANDLVSRGDNAGVKETVAEMQFFSERGETDVDWKVATSFAEFLEQVQGCGCEYYYIMRDGAWYAGCVYDTEGLTKGGLTLLAQALSVLAVVQDE